MKPCYKERCWGLRSIIKCSQTLFINAGFSPSAPPAPTLMEGGLTPLEVLLLPLCVGEVKQSLILG